MPQLNLDNDRKRIDWLLDGNNVSKEKQVMLCGYPVAMPFYLAATAILILAFLPRYLEIVLKSRVFWAVGAALFVAAMLLLPSRNHLLGDGMTHLANPDRVVSFTEPLELLVHRLVFLLTGSSLISYRIVAVAAGLAYLLGTWLISKLTESWLEKSIIALAFFCLGTIQFYCGYVEHYTLLNLFGLFYIYVSWRDIKYGRTTIYPLIFFLLAFVSHLSAIVLLPSLFYLYQTRYHKWLVLLAIPVVAAGIVAAIAVDFQKITVPLTANDFSDYTLFSVSHLSDLLMILLLISPAFFLAFWKSRLDRRMIFTLIALAGALCFTIVIDPKIGALRDWDLLSIFAVPLAALIALRAPRHYLTVLILLVLTAVRIAPWIAFNSESQDGFIKKAVLKDRHYTESYDHGLRLVSWGVLLYKLNDWQGAMEVWKQKLTYTPDDFHSLTMLAPLFFKMQEYPEAYQTYKKMSQLQPDNPDFRYRAAYVLFRMGEYDGVKKMLAQETPEFRDNPSTRRLIAGLMTVEGHHQEAVAIIDATPMDDADGYLPYVLSKSCLATGRYELARALIGRAMQLDPLNNTYREFAKGVPQ